MKNVVEPISIKFRGFHVIKMNLVQIMLSTSMPNCRWQFVYQTIF